jgi:hypothetical protein
MKAKKYGTIDADKDSVYQRTLSKNFPIDKEFPFKLPHRSDEILEYFKDLVKENPERAIKVSSRQELSHSKSVIEYPEISLALEHDDSGYLIAKELRERFKVMTSGPQDHCMIWNFSTSGGSRSTEEAYPDRVFPWIRVTFKRWMRHPKSGTLYFVHA